MEYSSKIPFETFNSQFLLADTILGEETEQPQDFENSA